MPLIQTKISMLQKKKEHPKEKLRLHPRNKHRTRYDFIELIKSCPELAPYVKLNAYQDHSIDFFNPQAVKMLNKALLKYDYDIDHWNIPKNYLCPSIPGRADHIHYLADLLGSCNSNKIPVGNQIKCLDIGVGANCVYPFIGNKEYGWTFIGTDIDPVAIESASKVVECNIFLKGQIELRLQRKPSEKYNGIIQKDEYFDLSICNPPFHASIEEANYATLSKLSNLKHKKISTPTLNFGGQNNELWCEGGEYRFVQDLIHQSKQFSASCFWFSTLISKQSNLMSAYKALNETEVFDLKTIPMSQGNKTSRIIAWTFLSLEQQKKWIETRWKNG